MYRLPLLKEHPNFSQFPVDQARHREECPGGGSALPSSEPSRFKIAITTCEQIITKNFSLEFDKTLLRVAATW